MDAMPAVFFGHGSPMNTLERNRYTDAWRAFGRACPRPRALLVVSAHWYVNATAVTAMEHPRVIHDFYGFPEELFAFDYPAPGSPEVAAEVVEALAPVWCGLDRDSWGIDHGSWSVLAHAFPDAGVPVVQLSVNALEPPAYHLALGRRLAALRHSGVVVVGSGNAVHNLPRMNPSLPDSGYEWARRFDEAARAVLRDAPGDAARLAEHPDWSLAVPTPDHFLPLLYVAGYAAATGETPRVLVDGYAYGSLSMTCWTVGLDVTAPPANGAAAALPGDVPPEGTNT